jgi:hypothetical protein
MNAGCGWKVKFSRPVVWIISFCGSTPVSRLYPNEVKKP